MTTKHGILLVIAAGLVALIGYFAYSQIALQPVLSDAAIDSTPQDVTLTGTFECLPHRDTSGPRTMECAFGFRTDDGVRYAVNFGASASAAEKFQSGAHITADGNVVPKEALSTNQWEKYDMEGIFTIYTIRDGTKPSAGAKLHIDEVCNSALAYTTFSDGAAAEAFVKDCKEGKHPEVIERYKRDMNLGDGAAI